MNHIDTVNHHAQRLADLLAGLPTSVDEVKSLITAADEEFTMDSSDIEHDTHAELAAARVHADSFYDDAGEDTPKLLDLEQRQQNLTSSIRALTAAAVSEKREMIDLRSDGARLFSGVTVELGKLKRTVNHSDVGSGTKSAARSIGVDAFDATASRSELRSYIEDMEALEREISRLESQAASEKSQAESARRAAERRKRQRAMTTSVIRQTSTGTHRGGKF